MDPHQRFHQRWLPEELLNAGAPGQVPAPNPGIPWAYDSHMAQRGSFHTELPLDTRAASMLQAWRQFDPRQAWPGPMVIPRPLVEEGVWPLGGVPGAPPVPQVGQDQVTHDEPVYDQEAIGPGQEGEGPYEEEEVADEQEQQGYHKQSDWPEAHKDSVTPGHEQHEHSQASTWKMQASIDARPTATGPPVILPREPGPMPYSESSEDEIETQEELSAAMAAAAVSAENTSELGPECSATGCLRKRVTNFAVCEGHLIARRAYKPPKIASSTTRCVVEDCLKERAEMSVLCTSHGSTAKVSHLEGLQEAWAKLNEVPPKQRELQKRWGQYREGRMKAGIRHAQIRLCSVKNCVIPVYPGGPNRYCLVHSLDEHKDEGVDRWETVGGLTALRNSALQGDRKETSTDQEGMQGRTKGHRICPVEGCRKQTCWGPPGGPTIFCKAHAEPGMVPVRYRYCHHEGCQKVASFGAPGEKALYCRQHLLPGMVNRANRACVEEGCPRRPYFGWPGSRDTHCQVHALEGMSRRKDRRKHTGYASDSEPQTKPVEGFHPYQNGNEEGVVVERGGKPLWGPYEDSLASRKRGPQGGELQVTTKKLRGSKHCTADNCNKMASFGPPGGPVWACRTHAEPGWVAVRAPKCAREGCTTVATLGFPGGKVASCKAHAQPGMVNLRDRRCAAPGCELRPSLGWPGKRPLYCAKHAEPGMERTFARPCRVEGCSKRPCYGYLGHKAECCRVHAEQGMVNLASPRCEWCQELASYGWPGQALIRCRIHAEQGMEVPPYRRCEVEGCGKRPTYGEPGNRPSRCKAHAETHMENIGATLCGADGCNKVAGYRGPGQELRRCAEHRLPNMGGFQRKRCGVPDCRTEPSFGWPGQHATWCKAHAEEGMVNVKKHLCEREDCLKTARYRLNNQGPWLCYVHKEPGMVDVTRKLCGVGGCTVVPSYGYHGEKSTRCVLHAEPGMEQARLRSEWGKREIAASRRDHHHAALRHQQALGPIDLRTQPGVLGHLDFRAQPAPLVPLSHQAALGVIPPELADPRGVMPEVGLRNPQVEMEIGGQQEGPLVRNQQTGMASVELLQAM